MRVNKIHKFIFISTPKACTHTIYNILDEHYSFRLRKFGFHCNNIPERYKNYFRWTVVRNPFSRAVSIWWSACRLAHKDQYKFRVRSGGQYDFTKFIVWLSKQNQNEALVMNQSNWLRSVEPYNLIHMENLEEELKQLPFWKEGIKIPQLNTTTEKIETQSKAEEKVIKRPSLKELYKSKRAIEAVLKWAEEDFDKFEYERDIKWLKK
ncbi:MAG: sulfotransferase family 2 domain-containing protein [Candidatus Heimdallarchaeaceae archaeon]